MRVAFESCPEIEVVHINEPAALESSAYLLKFDSTHGRRQALGRPELLVQGGCVSWRHRALSGLRQRKVLFGLVTQTHTLRRHVGPRSGGGEWQDGHHPARRRQARDHLLQRALAR